MRERLEQLSKDARGIKKEVSYFDPNRNKQLRSSAGRNGFKFIGAGVESIVIRHPKDRDRVVALGLEEREATRQKRLFYLNRLMTILFPHNFAKIFFASGGISSLEKSRAQKEKSVVRDGSSDLTVQIRKRIRKVIFSKAKHGWWDTVYPSLSWDRLGFHLRGLDASPENLIIGGDGGEYLIDPLRPEYIDRINIGKLEHYMKENKYSESDIDMALRSARRFIALGETETRK